MAFHVISVLSFENQNPGPTAATENYPKRPVLLSLRARVGWRGEQFRSLAVLDQFSVEHEAG